MASGLGIMVMIALMCNIFALQRPHGRSAAVASNDSTKNADSSIIDAPLEQRTHLNIDDSDVSFSDYRGSI